MRSLTKLAIAAALLGFSFAQPAAAFDDSRAGYGYGCCNYGYGGTVYIHHHIYLQPRYRHVYHYHTTGARHFHAVHGNSYPWAWRGYRRDAGYFEPRYRGW